MTNREVDFDIYRYVVNSCLENGGENDVCGKGS
jgi:hypothetical protein